MMSKSATRRPDARQAAIEADGEFRMKHLEIADAWRQPIAGNGLHGRNGQHALQSQIANTAQTDVCVEGSRIIGYAALAVGAVNHGEAPERLRKGLARYPEETTRPSGSNASDT